MSNQYSSFRDLCNTLFSDQDNFGEQREAAQELFKLLATIINYDDAAPVDVQTRDEFLPQGNAISLQGAARCLWEFARTNKFLRGVEAALRQAQQKFPGQRLRLLEAGCGPFALLALPMAVRFQPHEVGFVLLDFHSHTLEAVKRIIAALGLEAYVDAYVQADATTWQCPAELRPHVVVSETMRSGLRKEPQVAVTRNLAPQRISGGFFVPEKVTVEFSLLTWHTPENEVSFQRTHPVATLFELLPDDDQVAVRGRFALPETIPASARAGICTGIQVFGDIHLGENQCSLTLPIRVKELLPLQGGMVIDHEYIMGSQPGIRLVRVE